MTIEEMHIAIDLELQKINTFTQKNILSQEKDWFLNNEVTKFIKQRTNPVSNMKRQGTDATVKRYEDLSDLTRRITLDVEMVSENVGKCILPSNYYGYITSKLSVHQLCENEEVKKESKNLYLCVVPLSFSDTTVLSEYKRGIKQSSTSQLVTIYDIKDLPADYLKDVPINEQRFMLIKSMKILMKEGIDKIPNPSSTSYSIYWEKYGDTFYNNSFIIVCNAPIETFAITVNNATNYLAIKVNSYNIVNESSELWAKTRLIEDEYQFEVEQSNLSESRPESPVIAIQQGVIHLDFPLGVISNRLQLLYISKPTILDLALKRNLNMKDTVSKEIVGNTIRFMKGVLVGDYKTYVSENMLTQ